VSHARCSGGRPWLRGVPERAGFAGLFDLTRAQGRLALLPWVMAGYPSVDSTVDLLLALEGAGADGFELAVPFSDPIADGPTIQVANQAALANGVTPTMAIDLLATARKRGLKGPVAMMGYLNPIVRVGVQRYCDLVAKAGGNGLIVADLPFDEVDVVGGAAARSGLELVQFVAPTSPQVRIRAAAKAARGFVYVVSLTGTTGARTELAAGLDDLIDRVRAATKTPVVVGFGISKREHLAHLRGKADGVIVASALVNTMREASGDPVVAAAVFVRELLAG
jgi:tryptophan synthase alpha chain